jgi:hypothetical protein
LLTPITLSSLSLTVAGFAAEAAAANANVDVNDDSNTALLAAMSAMQNMMAAGIEYNWVGN